MKPLSLLLVLSLLCALFSDSLWYRRKPLFEYHCADTQTGNRLNGVSITITSKPVMPLQVLAVQPARLKLRI